MTTDLDILRSAKPLIDQHGEHAALEAALRADAPRDKGDLDGQAVWPRIRAAVVNDSPGMAGRHGNEPTGSRQIIMVAG